MRFPWVVVGGVIIVVAELGGCRHLPPELKPPKQPEVIANPPSEARYDNSIYPKEAFASPDLFKKRDDNAIMPAKGPGGGMGNGMMNPGMMNPQRGPY